MTEILKIGRLLKTDQNGFIISESAASKIKSPWKESVEEIKHAYIKHLGHDIHSIYVRGTVSRGEAIKGISDIDTFAVLNRKIAEGEWYWFKDVRKKIEEKYSFITDVDFDLFEYEKIANKDESFEDRFTIKVQSACIYGDDLSPEIPPFKADIETAKHLRPNLKKMIGRVGRIVTGQNLHSEDISEWSRWIMKRILRAGFILVMDKEKSFTRDLYPSYEAFSKYYPKKEPLMRQALEYAINPPDNWDEVISFINDFGIWLANEIENKLS